MVLALALALVLVLVLVIMTCLGQKRTGANHSHAIAW
jgi:hypothetical protein